MTVSGHINPDIPTAETEQRIVEPALVDTAIGGRDVRALPGPVVPSDKAGYSSGMEFPTADTFKATYVFDDPGNAEMAANAALGERMMAWQVEDAAANRQGLTIAEFGELAGPGMGGCPAGPGDQTAPQAVRRQDVDDRHLDRGHGPAGRGAREWLQRRGDRQEGFGLG